MATPFTLEPAVVRFLGGGVAMVLGTASADLEPEICRVWGPSWHGDHGRLDVVVPLPAGRSTLENLSHSNALALTFCAPTDYTAFQLKGVRLEDREPRAAEWRRARSHFDAFLAEAARVGLDPAAYAPWFPAEGRLLVASIDAVFSQSPGPGAGRPL